jgi:DNA-binding MarR family transcriptional regulator
MKPVTPDERDPQDATLPKRGQLNQAVRESLRDLAVQLSLLTNRVGGRLDLKGSDLDCLDLITRHGPVSPGALARMTGMHPATMTGVIDRLERGGWITRDRDPHDRRGVVVQPVRARGREVFRLFGGMNAAVTEICADYSDAELELLADFIHRTARAGRAAVAELAQEPG